MGVEGRLVAVYWSEHWRWYGVLVLLRGEGRGWDEVAFERRHVTATERSVEEMVVSKQTLHQIAVLPASPTSAVHRAGAGISTSLDSTRTIQCNRLQPKPR